MISETIIKLMRLDISFRRRGHTIEYVHAVLTLYNILFICTVLTTIEGDTLNYELPLVMVTGHPLTTRQPMNSSYL